MSAALLGSMTLALASGGDVFLDGEKQMLIVGLRDRRGKFAAGSKIPKG